MSFKMPDKIASIVINHPKKEITIDITTKDVIPNYLYYALLYKIFNCIEKPDTLKYKVILKDVETNMKNLKEGRF